MSKREKLNERMAKAAEPRAKDYLIFDEEVTGFALCIYRSGNRAFALTYSINGRQRRFTIGRWPEWSVTAAREWAKSLRREIDMGTDPLAGRVETRDAPRISDLIDRFIKEHVPNLALRNGADQISMLRKLVEPHWRNRLVADITPSDVAELLSYIAEGRPRPSKPDRKLRRTKKLKPSKPTPIRANRAGEMVRKMFTLAVAWKMRTDNPATGFHRRVETERERFLSMDEISRLAAALIAAEDQRAAGILRICLLTGARVGEARQARFDQFNLELAFWSKPATTTKQRKIHRLPISAEMAAIVRQRRLVVPQGCPWLFPGDVKPQPAGAKRAELKPVQEIRRFWIGIQKCAALPGVRIHDLRHTFASLLISGGASLEMIGKLLGHSQMKTTQRYAHLADSPLRAGVDAVAEILAPRPRLVG